MVNSRKPAFGAMKSLMSKKVKSRKLAKRSRQIEILERRELMTANFSPRVNTILASMYFTDQAAYEAQGQKLSLAFSGSTGAGGNGGAAGESNAPVNATEVEPNNIRATANFLPLGSLPSQSAVVNVAGQMQNIFDEDYYAFDLRKGDLLDARLVVPTAGVAPGAILFNSAGKELIYTNGLMLPGASGVASTKSPRFTDGATTLTYTIDTDGRYYFRVGDATLAYSLNLRVYRSTFEQEPIGTNQIMFLDFDGAFLRNDLINLVPSTAGQTFRVPAFSTYATQLGITQDQVPGVIDTITAKVESKLKTMLAKDTNNGFYPQSSIPGEFNITVVNSNSGDYWGQPNVSRVVIGGDGATVPGAGGGLLGIAQRVDIGNFDREDTALVMLDILISTAGLVPLAGKSSYIDMFTELASMVIAHEAGHNLGGIHQDPNNNVFGIMDQFYDPFISSGSGRDGIFGTPDDAPLRFVDDEYSPTQGVRFGGGVDNSGQMLAFGMSTGTVGSTITGISFNDRNRNAKKDSSTEEGLAGWEVFADLNNDGIRELGEPRAFTGSDGQYTLRVVPGTYNVRIVRPAGWIASTDSELFKTVVAGVTATATANFGSVVPADTVTGFKWNDINGDGIRDTNEPGLEGVYIYLDLDGDARPDVGEPGSLSGKDGSYSLTPPKAGTYSIREVVTSGYVQTFPASGRHVVTYDGSTPLRGYDFGNQESSDFGDAPSPYPTTRADGGASHGSTPGLRLGAAWDADQDGQPSLNADGDDNNGLINGTGGVIDDEDGITLLSPIVRGDAGNTIRASVVNTTGTPSYLQGWIDFNGNGVWTDPGEQIATNVLVTTGFNNINFSAPAGAVPRTYARFRLSGEKDLKPTGKSKTGEVEDYVYSIVDGPRTLLQPDTFTVPRNSQLNPLDVLANDFTLPDDPWTITSVSSGAQGGRITIDATGKSVKYTPKLSFIGRDEFTYTATSASGRKETAKVTVNVTLQFIDPFAVDDSFDVPTNSIGFPLSVLANDVEGRGGSLIVNSVTNPDKGGTVSVGSGGQSIRYTPRRGFGGTEQFSYSVTDALGKVSTARVTVHTLQGDRLDDQVEFSFQFTNAAGEPITKIQQGETFKVVVYVDDLRPEQAAAEIPPRNITDPGVYSAYLDMLYSSGLVTPNAPVGGGLNFSASFVAPYLQGLSGNAEVPGIIDELGAFVGSVSSFNLPDRVPVAVLDFTASSAGIAEFVGDPADNLPSSEVTFYNATATRVSNEQIRFGRSSIEIVPKGVDFPFAVDDTRFNLIAGNTYNINVLANDVTGTQPPIRITGVTQPANGQTTINNNNTPNNFADDTITYVSNTNFAGVDQFKYTITDERGFTSIATVTLHVGDGTADDVIQLRLGATDLSGAPIDQIEVGQQFQLRGYVQDVRNNPTPAGVNAAYQDVLYDKTLVSVNTSATAPGFAVAYSGEYKNGQSGDVRIPGIINELGSFQTENTPTGLGEKLQFIVTLTARNTGIANFLGDPADIKPFHDSFVFNPTTPLTPDQIRFVSDSISIVAAGGGSGSSGGEGNTNALNPYDVNNDGYVSPIDVLILVNSMNTGSAGLLPPGGGAGASGEGGTAKYFLDVNQDNYLSPLDALMVINQLNSGTRGNGAGEGEGEGASAAPLASSSVNAFKSVLVDVPFLKKSSNTDNGVYGPLPSSEEIEKAFSLVGQMSSQPEGEDDFDYLDGLAENLLSKKA